MNKAKFQTTFLAMCEMYDKEVSKPLTKLYFSVIEAAGLSDEDFQSAVAHVMATHKYASLPKPAEIIECISGSPDDAAIIAIQKLESAIRSVGPYDSIAFDDPVLHVLVSGAEGGWPGLCQMTTEEWKFERMRLIKSYKAFAGRRLPDNVDHLAGICERDNGGRFPEWKPTIHYTGERKVKQVEHKVKEIASVSMPKECKAIVDELHKKMGGK